MTGNQSGQGWRMTTTIRSDQHREPYGVPVSSRMNVEETYQRLLVFYRPGCLSVHGCLVTKFRCSCSNPVFHLRHHTPT